MTTTSVWQAYCTACDRSGDELRPSTLPLTLPSPFPAALAPEVQPVCCAGAACALQKSHSVGIPNALDRPRASKVKEGHPDNVAPAILWWSYLVFVEGGHTVCSRIKIARGFLCGPLHRHIRCKRKTPVSPCLPKSPVETAVWQMGRVVTVTNALATGNAGLLHRLR